MRDKASAIKWYEENRPIYESIAGKVEDIIKENLEQNNIQYHSITNRPKSIESFSNKAKSEKYTDPIKEIKDMAGIRVITYLESDVAKVAEIIENLFDIDRDNSLDQSQLLGSDKLGYRSVHYVAKFNRRRCNLPEYKPYKNLPFEIQIRSILQHAWAEIEHDRNYKFTGKLPMQLERRFYLISGMLESADREFVAIAQEIDKYRNTVVEELGKGDLDIEINTASLIEYLSKRFDKSIKQKLVIPTFGDRELSATIAEELRLFGIQKLNQLDEIIPSDLQEKMLNSHYSGNFIGTIRYILIINDAKKYFECSWRKQWQVLRRRSLTLLRKYNVDIAYLQKHVKIQ